MPSLSFSTILRAKVRKSPFLLSRVWLILCVVELRLLPVDGRRNPKPTATVVVHLISSDSKAVAQLALQNLVRDMPRAAVDVNLIAPYSKAVAELALRQNLMTDIPQAPFSAGRAGEFIGKVDGLVKEGKGVIQSDLTQAVIGAVPVFDNFVAAMDKIAEVRTFYIRRFLALLIRGF